MPIRREAAEQLARDIFRPLIARGLADEDIVQRTAEVIEMAVRCDEREVRIADMLAKIAAQEKA